MINNLNEDLLLKYLIRPAKSEKAEIAGRPILIFLHGVGSNERDLFTLRQYLPEHFTVISARSPYSMDIDSFCFYEIDYSTGTKVINLEQAEKSRHTVRDFIGQVIEKYQPDPGSVFLAGFSQGAIMSFSVCLTFPGLVKSIAAFSGSILKEIRPLVKPADELHKLNVFMAHGIYDNVLPVNLARDAREYLLSLGINPEYQEFKGAHEIPGDIINNFSTWIKNQ